MSFTPVKIINEEVIFSWKGNSLRCPLTLNILDTDLDAFLDYLDLIPLNYIINPNDNQPTPQILCPQLVTFYLFNIMDQGIIFSFKDKDYRTPVKIIIDNIKDYNEFSAFLDVRGLTYTVTQSQQMEIKFTEDPDNDCLEYTETVWDAISGTYNMYLSKWTPVNENGNIYLEISPKASWGTDYHPYGLNISGDNIDSIYVYQDAPGSSNNNIVGYSEYTPQDTIPLSFKLDSNGNATCDIGYVRINFNDPNAFLLENDINFVSTVGDYSFYQTNTLNLNSTPSGDVELLEVELMANNFEGSLYTDFQNLDYPRAFSFDITNSSGLINYYITDNSVGILADQIINMGFNIPINTIKTTGIYKTDYRNAKITFQSDTPFTLNSLKLYFSDCYKNYPAYDDSQNLSNDEGYYLIDKDTNSNGINIYEMYFNAVHYKNYFSGMTNGYDLDIDSSNNVYVLDNGVIKVLSTDLSLVKTIDKGISFEHIVVDNNGNLILSAGTDLYSLNIDTENLNWTYSDSSHPINAAILDIKVDSNQNIYLSIDGLESGGYIFKIDKDGNYLWSYNDGYTVFTKIDWDASGCLYALNGNGVTKLDDSGNLKWQNTSISTDTLNMISIDSDSNVFVGGDEKKLYKLDLDGNILGTFSTTNNIIDMNISNTPNILILFDSGDNVYKIDYSTMTQIWKQTIVQLDTIENELKRIKQYYDKEITLTIPMKMPLDYNISTYGSVGYGRDYTTGEMANWEADTTLDLVGNKKGEVLYCYKDDANNYGHKHHETQTTFSGAINNDEYFRVVMAAPGEKHNGINGTGVGFYGGDPLSIFEVREENFRIYDLEFYFNPGHNSVTGSSCISIYYDTNYVVGCMLGGYDGGTRLHLIDVLDNRVAGIVMNCIAYAIYSGNRIAFRNVKYCINCTFGGGYSFDSMWGIVGLYNDQFINPTSYVINSVSSDTALIAGSGPIVVTTSHSNGTDVQFVDRQNGNFHLSNSDTVCKGQGTDLSNWPYKYTIYQLTDDINGDPRPVGSNWSIGADEPGYMKMPLDYNISTYGSVGYGRDYTTGEMANWEADTTLDLVGNKKGEVLYCYKDDANTDGNRHNETSTIFSGAINNDEYFRVVMAAPGEKHNGIIGTGVGFSGHQVKRMFEIREENFRVYDLDIYGLGIDDTSERYQSCISLYYDTNCIDGCLFDTIDYGFHFYAVNALDGRITGVVMNCINRKNFSGYEYGCKNIKYSINNTFYGPKGGIEIKEASGIQYIINTIVYNKPITNNNVAIVTTSYSGSDIQFVDAANGDFHLSNSDTVCKGQGTDLSNWPYTNEIYKLTDDIDGDPRPVGSNWSIGADEPL